jgi:hypothetical protein
MKMPCSATPDRGQSTICTPHQVTSPFLNQGEEYREKIQTLKMITTTGSSQTLGWTEPHEFTRNKGPGHDEILLIPGYRKILVHRDHLQLHQLRTKLTEAPFQNTRSQMLKTTSRPVVNTFLTRGGIINFNYNFNENIQRVKH